MNTQNRRRLVLAFVLSAVLVPVAHADLVLRVDCARRALPSQATIAAGLGIANLDQAYQARIRLASVVNRSCQRAGGGPVNLVLSPGRDGRAPGSIVAVVERH